MTTIRPYQPKDFDNVQHICIETGPPKAKRGENQARATLLATYCDYYVEREPQNCFVIADENDEAVGYIICAENYWKYYEAFMRNYAPRTKGFLPYHRVECLASAWLPRFLKKYPAHLHINILPSHQRMGLGSKLMDTLTAHLREKGVPGVMLGVGADNKKGRNFYNKYGFKTLLRVPFSVIMGLEL